MYLLLFIIIFIICSILLFMYQRGARYQNYISHCGILPKEYSSNDKHDFCGISTFEYNIPKNIYNSLKNIADSNISKRVNIYNWKAGKTVSTLELSKTDPDIIKWYIEFADFISKIIGEKVKNTDIRFPTSCALLIYDEKDDFINWHFDQNHFKGRFFTVLLPITKDKTCTEYIFKNSEEIEQSINHKNIIFEGEKVFHMASKLCDNQKRVVLSLQYVTDDNINIFNSLLMKIKDLAYIGF